MPPRRPLSGRSQSPRARYAQELHALRHRQGLSLRALADALGCDHSHLGHMEQGHTLGGPELAQALDKFHGTTHLAVLWELGLHDPSQFRERYRKYMSLEAAATGMDQYALCVLPGLLQTPEYATELLRAAGTLSAEKLERQVQARMGRQERLRGDSPPEFRAILDETVLRKPLKDPMAWREQLAQLLKVSEWPHVTIQVVLSSAGIHGLTNMDTMLLRLPEGSTSAYVETGYSGELVEEPHQVDPLRVAYDRLRDLALSPREAREFITDLMEDAVCAPPEST